MFLGRYLRLLLNRLVVLSNAFRSRHLVEILKGGALVLVAQIMVSLLDLGSQVVVTRYYGAGALGVLSIVLSLLAISAMFTHMGTKVSILRFVPEHIVKYSYLSAWKVYEKTLLIVTVASFFVGIFIFSFSDFIATSLFKKGQLAAIFSLAAVFILFRSLTDINMEAVRAFQSIKSYVVLRLFPSFANFLILIVLTVFFFKTQNPTNALFISLIVTVVFGYLLLRVIYKEKVVPGCNVKEFSCSDIITVSFPMLLTTAMQTVIAQSDIVMLGMMKSVGEVGLYAVVVKLSMLVSFVLSSVNTISAPKFSELYHMSSFEELKSVCRMSSKLMFWGSFPVVAAFIFWGEPILSLYGEEFIGAYRALFLLAIGQFVNSASGSVAYLLNMTGGQVELNRIVLVGAVVNIGMNFLLIPRHGIVGAAFASMVSISTVNILASLRVKKKFGFFIGYLPFFGGGI